ncbi:hypothetical protein [Rhodomicrobium lacus]|uniref:hypothetical protein n=1 Tax=Rhodomicrobium lacus TaxID=2498452 RepID=UPI000F8D790A|nr:hypothetical protein [Rhodomicrobium lacus]
MHTTTPGWRVQLGTGAVLFAMAGAATAIDLANNIEYGATYSTELAAIMGLAAVGLVAIPTAASALGWSRHLKLATALCVVLTVWAAANAYTAKQGAAILTAEGAQARYAAAQADAKRARETLAAIAERGQAEELTRLLADAAKVRKAACRYSGTACDTAQASERTLTQRLSDAKARDKAEATLALAEGKAEAGPAEASMLATVIAAHVGADASSVARWISVILAGLSITVTQALALMAGYAASLIGGALAMRKAAAPKARRERGAPAPTGGTKEPLPANVVTLDAHRHSVKAWLGEATVAGGEMRGGEALKAYKRWAGRMADSVDAAQIRSILAELTGAVERRNSGFVVRGLSLRTASAPIEARAAI